MLGVGAPFVPDAAPADEAAPGSLPDLVDLSVVIPAFNEQRRIGYSMNVARQYLDTTGRAWELIVVDDGSTDGTAAVVQSLADRDPRISMLRLGRNRGKGYALRVGVLASRGTEVLISDADMSTPIAEIERLWAVAPGAAVVIASRALPGSRIEARQDRVRQLLGRMGNALIRAVAVPHIRDTQCGFKLLRGRAARVLMGRTRLNGWGIDVEILHLCARFGWPVVEVPVRWRHRAGSKLRPLAYLGVLAEVAYVRMVHRRARSIAYPDDDRAGDRGASP